MGACLVGREADFVVHGDLEERVGVLELHHRGTTQVSVCVVTVPKCQAIDTAVGLVICCSIIQEPTNTSTL